MLNIKPCPYCGKTPKAFIEGRFVKNEDEDRKWLDKKWIYDGTYLVVECRHFGKETKSENKCVNNIPITLIKTIENWNQIT